MFQYCEKLTQIKEYIEKNSYEYMEHFLTYKRLEVPIQKKENVSIKQACLSMLKNENIPIRRIKIFQLEKYPIKEKRIDSK